MSTSLLLVSALSWVAQTLAEGEGEVAAVGEAPAEGGAGTAKVEYAQYIMDYFQDLGIQPEHVAYVIAGVAGLLLLKNALGPDKLAQPSDSKAFKTTSYAPGVSEEEQRQLQEVLDEVAAEHGDGPPARGASPSPSPPKNRDRPAKQSPKGSRSPSPAPKKRPSAKKSPPPPSPGGGEVVETIVRQCLRGKNKGLYLVKWEGYADNENTWESAENLKDNTAFVEFMAAKAPAKKPAKSPARGRSPSPAGLTMKEKRVLAQQKFL